MSPLFEAQYLKKGRKVASLFKAQYLKVLSSVAAKDFYRLSARSGLQGLVRFAHTSHGRCPVSSPISIRSIGFNSPERRRSHALCGADEPSSWGGVATPWNVADPSLKAVGREEFRSLKKDLPGEPAG